MFETIAIERQEDGIAVLRLDRPEKHNAMSAEMIAELHRAAGELGNDPSVRAVILTGNGKSFCAGGDLAWMRAQMEADAETRRAGATALAMMLKALNEMPKPLIGAVQGNAFGGGVGLVSVCDVAFAAETARFGLTETRLGLIPATIGPYVLARMGEGLARRVFMSSRLFDSAEAVSLHLVARAVPAEGLWQVAEAEATAYLACAPGAVASAKALTRRLGPTIDDSTINASIDALIDRWETDEARGGIAAFFDKSPPPWSRK